MTNLEWIAYHWANVSKLETTDLRVGYLTCMHYNDESSPYPVGWPIGSLVEQLRLDLRLCERERKRG